MKGNLASVASSGTLRPLRPSSSLWRFDKTRPAAGVLASRSSSRTWPRAELWSSARTSLWTRRGSTALSSASLHLFCESQDCISCFIVGNNEIFIYCYLDFKFNLFGIACDVQVWVLAIDFSVICSVILTCARHCFISVILTLLFMFSLSASLSKY